MPQELKIPPRVTERAFARLAAIVRNVQQQTDNAVQKIALRVAVDGGGCSGFQYAIDLDTPAQNDLILTPPQQNHPQVIIDPQSLEFLYGATIDFSNDLIGARFVVDNPRASNQCGCGTSFSFTF